MFGHIAQIPQIMQGFGIDNAVIWRGVAPKKSVFLWEGLDKSTITSAHLTDGYYNTFLINYNNQKKDLQEQLKKLKDNAYSDLILFPNGGDHLAPVEQIKEIINDMNISFPDFKFIQSTLEEYFQQLKINKDDLEIISGELRDNTVERAYILSGVFSARIPLKQRNYKIQNLLTNWVEPLSVISWLLGNDYNQGFINLAWKNLLLNQPHDSICGCSTDQVHTEMIPRYDAGDQIANKLIDNAMTNIANSLNLINDHYYLVFFNTSNWTFNGTQEIILDFLKAENVESFKLEDQQGNEVAYQIIEKTDLKKFISEINVLPDWIDIRRFKIVLELNNLNSLSNKYLKVLLNESNKSIEKEFVHISDNTIDNDLVKISVKDNYLQLENLLTKDLFKINSFESSGDAGDEYNYSPPKNDFKSIGKIVSSEIFANNNLEASLKVSYELKIPKELATNRESFVDEKVNNYITSFITLKANDANVYIKTIINNQSKDHKLRVNFSNNLMNKYNDLECNYDTAFGILKKTVIANNRSYDVKKYQERIEETFAIQNFADLSDNKSGITLTTKGLPEVEIISETNQQEEYYLSLTLLRCVGWLSRDDLRTRGGGAGPSFATPEAQELGINEFEYILYAHNKSFSESDSLTNSYQTAIGINYLQHKSKDKTKIGIDDSLIKLSPKSLVISTLKRSENQNGIIFRFYNPLDYIQNYEVKANDNFEFSKAFLVRLDETVISELITNNSVFRGEINPYQIITIEFKNI